MPNPGIHPQLEDQDTFNTWLQATNLLITQLREGTSQDPLALGIPYADQNGKIDTDWLKHQVSKLDDTQGRLLQVGAFGLGGTAPPVPNDNLDNLSLKTGVYSVDNATPVPDNFSSNDGLLFHLHLDGDHSTQMLFDLAGENLWRRSGTTSNGWSSWYQLLHTGNTVSLDYVNVTGPFQTELNTGYAVAATETADAVLPANPTDVNGEIHIFRRAGSWEANPTTVKRNGNTIEGKSEDMVIDSDLIRLVRLKWVKEGTWRVFG